jgi:hypothetical protein
MPGLLIGPSTGFTDRSLGKGTVSRSWLARIGKSTAQASGGGNVFSQLSAAGVGNGADTTVDTLMSASLPANLFDIPGVCVTVQAFGTVIATSATKTVSFKFGAGVNQSIVSYTTTNLGSWQFYAQIFKVSANVQLILIQADAGGTTASLLGASGGRASAIFNGAETDTAAIPIAVTGQSTVATANTVTCQGFVVDAYN